MKKLYPLLLVIATPVILLLMSNSTGSIGGKTGSVGDNGTTCTECHGGNATTIPDWITTNVPAEGYTPGQTYIITATGTHAGVVKFGFELTVENSQGDKVGTLQLTDQARTRFTNSNQAITHTAAGNVPAGDSNSWSMNWIAPFGVIGNVGIYAAFNAANGNGNNTGDIIYKSSIFISEAVPAPLLESIVPNAADLGQVVNTTINGLNTDFGGTPGVFLSYSGNGLEVINATNVVVVNAEVIQADFSIPESASTGLWDLHVGDLRLDDSFTINSTIGIADNGMRAIRVYPNPADQHFFIDNVNGSELSIFNSSGDLVTNMKVMNEKQQVNISQLSSGLYFIKIKADGQNRIEKLLVN